MKKDWRIALMMSAGIALCVHGIQMLARQSITPWGTFWELGVLAIVAVWYACLAANDMGVRNTAIICPLGVAIGMFLFQWFQKAPNWNTALVQTAIGSCAILGYIACRYLALRTKKA